MHSEASIWPSLIGLVMTRSFASSVLSGALLAIFGLFLKVFHPRPRVVWGISHSHSFSLPLPQGGTAPVVTQSVFIQNAGRAEAERVEVYLNFAPTHYEIWPAVKHTTSTAPGATPRLIIEMETLSPGERLTLEMIQVGNHFMPEVLRVRHKLKEARRVLFRFVEMYPTWKNTLIGSIFILGVFYSTKIVIDALLKFVLLSPAA